MPSAKPRARRAYVLLEVAWADDGRALACTEDRAGHARTVYLERDDAVAELHARNRAALQRLPDLRSYSADLLEDVLAGRAAPYREVLEAIFREAASPGSFAAWLKAGAPLPRRKSEALLGLLRELLGDSTFFAVEECRLA